MNKYDQKEITKILVEKLPNTNIMELPKIVSVSINTGIGHLAGDKNAIANVVAEMTAIAGQKALVTKAKKSISSFKIRENFPVGVMVTLRGQKMNDFLIKLINITLPRLRDFNGINKKSFDGHGNLSIGFKEQIYFPEIKFESVDKTYGLQINIKTTAKDDQSARILLEVLGLPFNKED